ncbi:hypothetical protein BKA69DRAFT_1099687 [Paraphysoderma sedebokerense]|nr:hypothetical protein BKA69DRAFT_1099687 [Paraphysoderma sedebokerense]
MMGLPDPSSSSSRKDFRFLGFLDSFFLEDISTITSGDCFFEGGTSCSRTSAAELDMTISSVSSFTSMGSLIFFEFVKSWMSFVKRYSSYEECVHC